MNAAAAGRELRAAGVCGVGRRRARRACRGARSPTCSRRPRSSPAQRPRRRPRACASRASRRAGARAGRVAGVRRALQPRDVEQQPDLEHRDAQMRGDELLLQALLDGEPAERRLEEDQPERGECTGAAGRGRRGTGARRAATSVAIRIVTIAATIRCVYSTIMFASRSGHDAPVAERPAVGAAALRAAAEAGVADPHDAADDDQQEREQRRPRRRSPKADVDGTARPTPLPDRLAPPARRAARARRAPPRARAGGCPSSARRCGPRGSRRSCARAAARA